ncbi:hypothetical protein GTP44_00995 [Duganella sp. FT50W]|uniref:Uncharacterized protein n=1 Tax=Duganella lactea TaxID=2692173 RepID=A0A6L8MFT8_9BURK|nr:hypothetical protein [Duganella lactea]MYM80536.1 hypothetical protein [Duganella lactea]
MANLLSKPRAWKSKAILFKLETAYGSDATPGPANWIEARNVSLTPMDTETVERNIEMPYMGSSGKIVVGKWAKMSFDIALVASGTLATPPKWGALLMACAFAQTIVAATSVQYNLVSKLISSASLYVNIDGTLHKLLGTRGSVKAKLAAKGTPTLSFAFDAMYVAPVEQDMPVVNTDGWEIEEGINSENTGPASLGGVHLAWSDFSWDQANKIARLNLPGPQREVSITDRAASGEITVLAPPLADFDPFALSDSGSTIALSVLHGSVPGKKVQVDLQVRVTNVAYDNVDGVLAYKLTLDAPPVMGNDELAITCL